MRVAIPATGPARTDEVDPRFGRTRWFLLADTETGAVEAHDNTPNLEAAQGAGIQAAQRVVELGAEAVVTSNAGPKAFRVLRAAGVRVYRCEAGTAEEVLALFREGRLAELDAANAASHWA